MLYPQGMAQTKRLHRSACNRAQGASIEAVPAGRCAKDRDGPTLSDLTNQPQPTSAANQYGGSHDGTRAAAHHSPD